MHALKRCRLVLFLVSGLAVAGTAQSPAGLPAAATALHSAVDHQRRILATLAGILQEEKVQMSDGAVQAALEGLLRDEEKQAEGIRALGQRTLGKREEELTDEDRATRNQIADNQDVYTDRYRRLEKVIEAKVGARPNSVFSQLLLIADETRIMANLRESPGLVRQNQLGRALAAVNAVVEALRRMVETVAQQSSVRNDGSGSASAQTLKLPSLWLKSPDQALTQFSWAGESADAIGAILRGMKRLQQLAERQRQVAERTAARAPQAQIAQDLAREEWDIRFQALEVAAALVVLSPKLDQMIRQGASAIEQAIPGMEQGPLADAVQPAAQAADELQAAADLLRSMWKDILQRLKQYTQEATPIVGGALGIPHGMSKKMLEFLQQLALMMLRATGALTEAIAQQNALLEQTRAAQADDALPPLEPQQADLVRFVSDEVVPFNVPPTVLPAAIARKLDTQTSASREMLEDSMDRMRRSAQALTDRNRDEAVVRQEQAVELMTDALTEMILLLQHLLGQFSPPGMALGESLASGIALDPGGGVSRAGGWTFGLPEERRERVHQAFRGNFPEHYAPAIKRYYQALTEEERWSE